MSEVKRFNFFIGSLGQEGRNADFVLASDFDAAQSELAALREELAVIKDECLDHVNLHKAWTKQRDGMQRRLTAAEQRNDDFARAVTELLSNAVDSYGAGELVVQRIDIDDLRKLIAATNLSTEAESSVNICPGCGASGWTANCSKCIPY